MKIKLYYLKYFKGLPTFLPLHSTQKEYKTRVEFNTAESKCFSLSLSLFPRLHLTRCQFSTSSILQLRPVMEYQMAAHLLWKSLKHIWSKEQCQERSVSSEMTGRPLFLENTLSNKPVLSSLVSHTQPLTVWWDDSGYITTRTIWIAAC